MTNSPRFKKNLKGATEKWLDRLVEVSDVFPEDERWEPVFNCLDSIRLILRKALNKYEEDEGRTATQLYVTITNIQDLWGDGALQIQNYYETQEDCVSSQALAELENDFALIVKRAGMFDELVAN